MGDFNSQLPIRTEVDGAVVARIADGATPSQHLAVDSAGRIIVKLQDGAGNAISSQANGGQQALDVGINVGGVQIDPRSIRSLLFASDTVDVSGSSVTVSATDLDIRNLLFATDKVDVSGSAVTVSATDLDIRNLVFATDKVDVSGSAVTVSATDLDIRDLAAATDSVSAWLKDASGNPFSAVNPLPVAVSSDPIGAEVNAYNTAANIASGATSNHDYTVTAGKTLLLRKVIAAASGKLKIEVQVETAAASGIFNTKFVAFSSTAEPTIQLDIPGPVAVVAGAKVRVIRTNMDNQTQDLYSTTSGDEV